MKYYKGVVQGLDEPHNGGSYVREHGQGNEQFNFSAVEFADGDFCLGFVETKSSRSDKRNELHIENIHGCELCGKEPCVDDVLVVWCATIKPNETAIVGWYDHATVYRQYQWIDFDDGSYRECNVIAKKEDCVLLPVPERTVHIWQAPVARKRTYGFGQSLVWYAQEPQAKAYCEKLIEQIRTYRGENWIDKSAENQ